MRTCVQTSMFQNGFPERLAAALRQRIPAEARFAFVASEFRGNHEKTDRYFRHFLEMFTAAEIRFSAACVVDGRMTPEAAQQAVHQADVVWLSGGNTPVQFAYLEAFGLTECLRAHGGVLLGMSAGAINLAETAVCTRACGHAMLQVYPGLGCAPYTVEPHFDPDTVSEELLQLSGTHTLYGLCDEAAILYDGENTRFFGDVYCIRNRITEKLPAE